MRLRGCALACALTVLGSLAASGPASAAPRHNHRLTITALPNPILAGEGVLIYGRLVRAQRAGETIRLYHHLRGSDTGYTLIGTTSTNSFGEYEFTRQESVVMTNRSWFVRGPDGTHSRTARERVAALLSLSASTDTTDTAHPVAFSGSVTPNHRFERVFLQKQNASADDWHTIASGLIDARSNYTIVHRFRVPGEFALRVVFRGDARNIRSASDSVPLAVQQAQEPDFTINTSAPIAPAPGSVTISGVLDEPGTATPEPSTAVQLWGRHADQRRFQVLADGTTGADGSYSFPQAGLSANTVYYVATFRMPHAPRRRTARLFQGVQDAVSMQASTSSADTGQPVAFAGTVMPDKAGHVVYLQKLGKDGEYHTVAIGFVRFDSTFRFRWTLGAPGAHTFRARITGDEHNVGAVSQPVSIVASAPPEASLPSGS